MSAFRPEAEVEYSRAHRASERRFSGPRALVAGLGALGAALLVAAELSPLAHVSTDAPHAHVVRTVQTGAHHAYALLPIALLAAILCWATWSTEGRLAGVALAVLGLVALGVALLADLPDVHGTGLVGTPATGLHDATASAAAGMYLETLGAITLIVAGALGTLAAPRRRSAS